MGEPTPSRFRIRLDDGAELPVGSVEALARRVARGDLAPDTALFDGSTGEWHDAADAPVVQFILDELRREGREIPPEWETRPPDTAEPTGPSAAPAPPVQPEPRERDPLELRLTPAALDDSGPALKNAWAGLDESPSEDLEAPPRPSAQPGRQDKPATRKEDEWLTSPSEGGLFASAPAGKGAALDPAATKEVSRPPERIPFPRRPRRAAAPSSRPLAWVAAALVGGVVLVGSGLLLGDGGGNSGSGSSAPAESGFPAPAPEGIEAAADGAISLLDRRFRTAVDSARVAGDLDSSPPAPWLTGYYLANAGEFPEVRAYWEGYGGLVEGLRVRDRAIVADFVESGLGPSVVPPEQRAVLGAYIEDRYSSAMPRRQELYAQLAAAAGAAIELHDFLLDTGAAIRFTPALGAEAVPRDPVLEVETDDPSVRRSLEAHLDAIFDALDRSRGGGPPAPAGLEEDLFGRFGTF